MGNVTNGINTYLSFQATNCRALIINRERYRPKSGIFSVALVILGLLQESIGEVLNSIDTDEQRV